MTRKRWLGLLVAALLVPLPAFALSGGSASASLGVSVSNGGCGVAGGSAVVCQLQVSFNAIDGATSYTATVTGPDGSVVDYGAVGAGGATIPVPYAGDGNYSVSISAWGEKPDRGHRKPLATDSSDPVGRVRHARASVSEPRGTRGRNIHARHASGTASADASTRSAGAGTGISADVQPTEPSPTDRGTTCVPLTPSPTPPPDSGSGDTGTTTTTPEAPPPPDCPDPQQDPSCCP